MIDEKDVMRNKAFLKDTGFEEAGNFYLDNGVVRFNSLMKEEVNGTYAVCVDGIVVYIGNDIRVNRLLSQYLCTGGSETNNTYQRNNPNILESLKQGKVVTANYVESFNGDNFGADYERIMGQRPVWNKQKPRVKKCHSRIFEKLTESDKQTFREAIEEDREREVKAQLYLNNSSLQVRRDYQEKIKALEKSGDRCALDGFNVQKCVTFARRNIIPGTSTNNYLEAHHLIPLFIKKNVDKINLHNFEYANLDTAENMVCLCSNCHNKIHYGKYEEVEPMLEALYAQKRTDLESKKLNIDMGNLLELYKFDLDYEKPKRK